ncbi:enoyl-CoA hydratase-related protein [Vibrio ostreicida]|uniref:Enoyl-CoA hydratase-related protein n=1 Tax=Vibrio ostreicida TaxID=526588 RepID=A0ABT8BYX9_9VIBR|nr:enoyl-CoA hydratase-related protein [Vibrio ostreicida]MDN3611554.1 enoyl-CoA hydratase-related protein [Vibrio ostreicida]NPD09046.1 gamma-carboxygeranoyl-CoA hydratase [Vibrio ostreicida]
MIEQTDTEYVTVDLDAQGVATLVIDRPNKHNAFNAEVIESLIGTIERLSQDTQVRCLVLRGAGKHFSTGADLAWMQSMASKSERVNQADASRLAHLMHCLDHFPHPTLALVHGCAFGGALGLICCCDIVIAEPSARFCLSEVKLGLVPATIGPYVQRTIGARQARRYMLTAETFNGDTARDLGLIHHLVEDGQATHTANDTIAQFLANSPAAMTRTKGMIHRCHAAEIDHNLRQYTSELIAEVRVSPQGQEGLEAFFNKRPPNWHRGGEQ